MTDKGKSMFKINILGDPSVGKTSIRKRYMGKGFSTSYLPTMGTDFAIKQLQFEDEIIELQLWDIAGQPSFEKLIPRFISNSNGTLVVFDLTRKQTFVHLTKWIKKYKDINENSYKENPIMIIGNKNDLDQQEVSDEEMENYRMYVVNKLNLRESNVKVYKTSALTGENVDDVFNDMIEILLD